MKVAFHVDQLWFDVPGGIGTYVRLLWGHLGRTPEVEIIPFAARWRRPPSEGPLARDGRLPVVRLPSSIRWLYPAWALLRRPHLPRALADADIVHATNHVAIPPVRSSQRLVVTVHDLAFRRSTSMVPARWRRLYERALEIAIDEASALLVPSGTVRDELIDAGADGSRVHVTPLGPVADPAIGKDPETRRLAREDLRDRGVDPPYVLSVGTLEPRKNHVRLVRAYRRLAGEGLPHALVLIGDRGWRDATLSDELERSGVPGTIVRVRGISDVSLAAAYADADAVAYVSLDEGFGLPVLEAMSMGAPVVTSNVSSMPEVAGDAALLVDPTDESAIADALRRVLTDPAVSEELRTKGRERARAFSWERTAEETVAVYRRVVGQAS